jgi:beta-lactamase class A
MIWFSLRLCVVLEKTVRASEDLIMNWVMSKLILTLFLALTPAAAQDLLDTDVHRIAAAFHGDVAMAARVVSAAGPPHVYSLNGDRRVKTASTIKLAVMTEAFFQIKDGKLHLDDPITLQAADRVQGSGILQDMQPGLRLTLEDAITLMIVESDNTATNLVLDRVGIPNVNARMAALGLTNTKVFKKVFVPLTRALTDEEKEFGFGVTTPNEMIKLLELMFRRQILDRDSCGRMLDILKKQRDHDSMQRYLLSEPNVIIANKSGALDDVRNDVGLMYTPNGTIAFAAFAYNSKDHQWSPDNEAHLTLAKLARAVYDAWIVKGASAPPPSPK